MRKPREELKEVQKEQPQKLVKMVKDGKEADVHPAEVENYKIGNWQVKD